MQSVEQERLIDTVNDWLGNFERALSGGEAQRLKLAGHLADARKGAKLFLFDEPTTGLHFEDIAVLLRAFRALMQRGHSLIVIEHNLEVIRSADWVLDLGPEGGDGGGQIIHDGPVTELLQSQVSHTAAALRDTPQTNNKH